MADKIIQLTDKDGNNIYPVSKLPGNAIVAEDLVQLTTTDLENLTNLITPILLSKVYPIGSIFISTNSTNPGAYLGGTWVAWGTGRTIVGIDTKDTNFNTVEKTGGTSNITPSGSVGNHTLTTNEIPAHFHQQWYNWDGAGNVGGNWKIRMVSTSAGGVGTWTHTSGNYDVATTGGDQPHNHPLTMNSQSNLQPYITCYMWKRTE